MVEILRAGWAFPGGARKAHYFEEGQERAVCGLNSSTGERVPDQPRIICLSCRRVRTQRGL